MSLTVIIPTYNEEMHIERCIRSVMPIAERICVIDSFSTDRTVGIARNLGAEVIQNKWLNYSQQFNYAMDAFDVRSSWTMRLDADEYIDDKLASSLCSWLSKDEKSINGIYLRRKIVFLNRPIKHGFFYPSMMLRIWRTGHGGIESRWMDEHIVLKHPKCVTLQGDLVDHNLNDLTWWINKHNLYASREVYDNVFNNSKRSNLIVSGQAARKRWLKNRLYERSPPVWRAGAYFLYRYIIGMGFLDGKEGLYFHLLQAFWYRLLVDAKLHELSQRANRENLTSVEFLEQQGIVPRANEAQKVS